MRILLLAYACEPNRGSEPGVGWKWATNLANDKTKEVHVLTRSNNKDVIESYWKGSCPSNLFFHYYDLQKIWIWAKHHGLPVNVYYACWLQGSCRFAVNLHKRYHFDMAHHITFGVFRDASTLYKLNIPYVIGPVGGGEMTPPQLLQIYTKKEILKERIRSFANIISFFNPWLIKSFNNASLILTKTKDTKDLLKKWESKTVVNLEIGINDTINENITNCNDTYLFVGRFTYWKGVKLVLLAYKSYAKKHPESKLIFIGKGEMDKDIKSFSTMNGLTKNISIIPWIKQDELRKYYSTSRAMIFPSLHDSSGNVVLEALSLGLPVICLDCGGPASVLGDNLKELTVETKDKNIHEIVNGIHEKMEMIANNERYLQELRTRCLSRAEEMLWGKTVKNSYKIIEDSLS